MTIGWQVWAIKIKADFEKQWSPVAKEQEMQESKMRSELFIKHFYQAKMGMEFYWVRKEVTQIFWAGKFKKWSNFILLRIIPSWTFLTFHLPYSDGHISWLQLSERNPHKDLKNKIITRAVLETGSLLLICLPQHNLLKKIVLLPLNYTIHWIIVVKIN